MAEDIDADVIIVGSGIAGAVLAAELAGSGVKVAILEAGDAVDRSTAVQTYWAAAIKVPNAPIRRRSRRFIRSRTICIPGTSMPALTSSRAPI